jgi:hypothetical protein
MFKRFGKESREADLDLTEVFKSRLKPMLYLFIKTASRINVDYDISLDHIGSPMA